MKINSIASPIFQKKLIAKCAVKKNDKPEQCYIYQLERKKDKKYFKNLFSKKSWNNAYYLKQADFLLKNDKELCFYTIEDSKEKCIGYCITKNHNCRYGDDLLYLEVKPSYTKKNTKRKTKYTGETLITFLTKLLKKEHKERLSISCMTKKARDFYLQNCGFEQDGPYRSSAIKSEKFDRLEEKNVGHTGSKINFIE